MPLGLEAGPRLATRGFFREGMLTEAGELEPPPPPSEARLLTGDFNKLPLGGAWTEEALDSLALPPEPLLVGEGWVTHRGWEGCCRTWVRLRDRSVSLSWVDEVVLRLSLERERLAGGFFWRGDHDPEPDTEPG